MASAKIFRINYKSDFILTLESDAGWMTPFCIKFWTGAPSQAFFAQWDGETYTHCAYDPSEPTKLLVQFDDHHLPIGELKYQVAYHFTVADFPNDTEDEVINPANITTEIDGQEYQVMLDFTGETAPEIEFSLPAYANEAQRIANEQQRIAAEQQRIEKEQQRIADEEIRQAHEAQRIAQETARVNEFATLKSQSQAATSAANIAAALANQKAQLAADKAALADDAATLANQKAQLAADKAALANDAAQLANEKAALAQQKAEYAQQQGGYAKDQGDYAKNQGDYAKEQGDTALADHQRAEADHGIAADDHTQAGNDHTRAESDHGIAVDDHTQAGNDHTRAESDHGIAADDHTQAGNDHTRAESDHTRAESDHAAVEVYVDSPGVFDLSKHNAVGGVLATYADLSAALTALNALDSQYKYGGMSFKFVQSSDNNYVQCRLMANEFTTDVIQWQKVDIIPSAKSKNLVDGGGIYDICGIVFKAGCYVEAATGNLSVFERHGYSELIPCHKGMSYKAKLKAGGNACVIAFYDEDMNFVSSISGTGEFAVYEGTIPSNIGYVRFGCTDITISSEYYAFLNDDKKHNVLTILNQDSFTENGYVKKDGTFLAITPPSTWKSTDFVEIQPGQSIFVNVLTTPSIVAILYFYDANKAPIPTYIPNDSDTKKYSASFVAPANAKYFRCSCNIASEISLTKKDDSFVVVSRFNTNDGYSKIIGNGSQFTENGYLDANGVAVTTTESWKTTPYIPVPFGAIYNVYIYEQSEATSPIVFYDRNKNIIGNVVSTQTGMTSIKNETPVGTAYIRICTKTSDISSSEYIIYYNAKNVFDYFIDSKVALKYNNNFVGKPFSFSGKTAVFFGDSVTDGVASANGAVSGYVTECYRKVLSDTLGFSSSLNRAVSGSYICDLENSANSILNKVISTITSQSNYDYIFIAGGVNDFWTGKPLGTITDNTYATFYGALNLMCSHLKTNAPNSNVIFFTPINCTRADLSAAVNTIDAYRNAIFEVAAMNLFNVVDTSKIGFPNDIKDTVYRNELISDGVHPTEKGHYMMGKNLAAILL